MKKRLICAVLLAMGCVSVLAQQKLKVGLGNESKAFEPAITALYKEIGLEPEFVILPSERSLRSVDTGDIDADMGRVVGAVAAYPNAMETTESILEIQLLAVVKKGFQPEKLSLADLKKYKLGHMRGTKMAEGVVKSLAVEATQANTMQSLFQMVAGDRFDIALTTSTAPVAAFPEFAGNLTTLPQPLLTTRVVHIMNKKWADYIPKFDAAVKKMRADGRLTKLLAAR